MVGMSAIGSAFGWWKETPDIKGLRLGVKLTVMALAATVATSCTYNDRTTPLGATALPVSEIRQSPNGDNERTTPLGAAAMPASETLQDNKYRYTDPAPKTLSIIVGSGGGTRAATFMLGILRTMEELCLSKPPGKTCEFTALDHVDMISTVSGSSLTSGYWAVHGKDKFEKLEKHLINSGLWDILWRYANPKNGVGTWFPERSQIDVLIERFSSDDGFEGVPLGDARFNELPPRPQLILNATDMSAKTTFAFTPQNFYHLCAELGEFKVVDAVAASAAFPVAFGSLALRNQSYRAGMTGSAVPNICKSYVEPKWIAETLRASVDGLVGDRSEFRRAERLKSYATNDCAFSENAIDASGSLLPRCVEWVHLLDGGIVDNLGITEPLWLVTNVHTEVDPAAPYATPYTESEKNGERPLIDKSIAAKIYQGDIDRIVVLVANVRSNSLGEFVTSGDNPGWGPQLGAVVGGSIDSTSDLLVGKLAKRGAIFQSLQDEICEYLAQSGDGEVIPECSERPVGNALSPRALSKQKKYAEIQERLKNLDIRIVPLDFDIIGRGIEDSKGREMRNYFQNIPTTWWLDEKDIRLLLKLPACMLSASRTVRELSDLLPQQPATISKAEVGRIKTEAGAEILKKLNERCTYDQLYKDIKAPN